MTQLFNQRGQFNSRKSVILYGKGNIGQEVMRILQRQGWNILCIFDQRAQPGEQINGVPIYHPDIAELSTSEKELPLIISIFNREVNIYEIAEKLRMKGFDDIIYFWDFHAQFPRELGDRFWLTDRNYYSSYQDEIEKVSLLWSDDHSRILFRDIIQSRLSGNLDQVDQHLNRDTIQYLPSDVPQWFPEQSLRFVDCGAFDGDTVEVLLDHGLPVESIAAFEPDIDNFNKLVKRMDNISRSNSLQMTLFPAAVGEQVEYLNFLFGNGESSSINFNKSGGSCICVELDSVLFGFKPNLIKMDIEGSEPGALLGASRIIRENLPRLAICVYHLADHIWKIPLSIQKISSKYRLYLRVHSYNGFDTVLYAVPNL